MPGLDQLSPSYLFASLFWGSVATGYLIYGRRQRSFFPFIGGVIMILVSYLVGSALWMSLLCLAILGAVWWLLRQGY